MEASTHLRASLVGCALFLAGGLVMESFLAGRSEGFVNDPLLREFVRLGHAHGGLLCLLNLGLHVAMRDLQTPPAWARPTRWASLVGAFAVGIGFFLGGLTHGPSDPGPLVLLVPAGAFSLLGGLLVVALVRPGDQSPPRS